MQPPLGRRTRQVSFCRKPGACRLRTGLTLSAQPPIPPPSPRRTVRSSIASRNRECVPLHVNPASARRPSTGRVRRSPQGYLLTRPVLWKRRGVNQRGGSTETTHRAFIRGLSTTRSFGSHFSQIPQPPVIHAQQL